MAKKYSVPKTAITERGLKQLMKQAVKDGGYSSISDWANAHSITPQQAIAFVNKTQGAGLKIPAALGYRPQTVFLPVEEELICVLPPPRRIAKKPTSKADHSREPIEKAGLKKKDDRAETKKRLKDRSK